MNTDEHIALARGRLAEAEAALHTSLGAMASARAALVVVEEENRELRREALVRQTRFYTEREFAAILKVSESTIERLRLKGKLKHARVGLQVRYTDEHFAQFAEDQKSEVKSQRSQGRSGLRIARVSTAGR